MTKVTLAWLASVVIVTSAVVMPEHAVADGRHGPRVEHRRLHTVPPPRFAPRRFFHRHAVPFKAPLVVYAPPAYATPVYVPPAYVPVPVYSPPVSVPAPRVYAPFPPTETVIQFPNGRYELRGDGITTPYRWVWIPNPPAAPPDEIVPEAAPEAGPGPAPPASERTRRIEVYRWIDDDGAVHLTDRLDNVPEAYRARVTKSQA